MEPVYLLVLQAPQTAHVPDQTYHGLSQIFCSSGISFLRELMVPLIICSLSQKTWV